MNSREQHGGAFGGWDPQDPSFADLQQLARQLEAALTRVNTALLKVAGVGPEELLDAYGKVQAKLLGFDAHASRKLREAFEEKRVQTLAQGNVFMTCVLASAVALSEFKKQPRLTHSAELGPRAVLARQVDALRERSTNTLSLSAFALASLYGVLGTGAWKHLGALRRARKVLKA